MNKRIIALMLFSIMILTLVGCGKKQEPTQVSDSFSVSEPELDPTPIPGVVEVETPMERPEDFLDVASPTEAPAEQNNEHSDVPETGEQGEDSDTDTVPSPTAEPIDPDSVGHIPNSTAYEQYQNMSGEDQLAFMESFDSVEAFVAWYNAAQAEYEAKNPAIEIDGSVIDMNELLGGTN